MSLFGGDDSSFNPAIRTSSSSSGGRVDVCHRCKASCLQSGKAFKCLNCQDYVVCNTCVLHREHGHPPNHLYVILTRNLNDEYELPLAPEPMTLPQKPSTPEKSVHPGIYCNGCRGSIAGARYKCGNCQDFDLCEDCWTQGTIMTDHPENHVLLLLPTPMPAPTEKLTASLFNNSDVYSASWRHQARYYTQRSLSTMVDIGSKSPIPMTGVEANVTVLDFLMQTELHQTFANTGTQPIEALYNFPLDSKATVFKFEVSIDDRVVKGQVEPKEDAKDIYDDAIASGYGAYLMEQNEIMPDVFSCKVGNLPPGKCAVVSLSYMIELERDDDASFGEGEVKETLLAGGKGEDRRSCLRLSLPSALAPRYAPWGFGFEESLAGGFGSISAPSVHPDKPKGTIHWLGVPCKNLLEVHLKVSQSAGLANLWSPTHKISNTNQLSLEGMATLTVSEPYLEKDITFFLELKNTPQTTMWLERPLSPAAEEGVLMVEAYPDLNTMQHASTGGNGSGMEFIFVLDRSGSMGGSRIQTASEALRMCLAALPEKSTFNIVSFGSRFELLHPQSVEFTDQTKDHATQFLHSVSANLGGTEILRPLEAVAAHPPPTGPSASFISAFPSPFPSPPNSLQSAFEAAHGPFFPRRFHTSSLHTHSGAWVCGGCSYNNNLGNTLMCNMCGAPIPANPSRPLAPSGQPCRPPPRPGFPPGPPPPPSGQGAPSSGLRQAQRRPRRVLLLTDGEVANTAQVVAFVAADCRRHADTRYFAFGIGREASRTLVRGVAEAGRGRCELVLPGERLQAKVLRQLRHALGPSLTGGVVDATPGLLGPTTPRVLPPLFHGQRVVFFARLPAGAGAAELPEQVFVRGGDGSGQQAAAAAALAVPLRGPVREAELLLTRGAAPGLLRRAAARRRLQELEAGWEDHGADDPARAAALKEEAVAFSVEHNLACKWAAFVAVEKRRGAVAGGPLQQVRVPLSRSPAAPPSRGLFGGRGMGMGIPPPLAGGMGGGGFAFGAPSPAAPAFAAAAPGAFCALPPPPAPAFGGLPSTQAAYHPASLGFGGMGSGMGGGGGFFGGGQQGMSLGGSGKTAAAAASPFGSTATQRPQSISMDDPFAAAFGQQAAPPPSLAVVNENMASNQITALLELQRANGSWEFTETLARILTAPSLDALKPADGNIGPLDGRIWATVVALVYLRDCWSANAEEWELSAGKAQRWLENQGWGEGGEQQAMWEAASAVVQKCRA